MSDPAGFVDYYSQCEDAVKQLLFEKLPDLFTHEWQVTDDETDLLRGADYFILMRPGSKPESPATFTTSHYSYVDWRVNCNLFTKWVYKKLQWPAFKRYRALVWFVLEKHQWMASDANVEKIVSLGFPEEPFYWKFKNTAESADPNMMAQPMFVVLRQRINHSNT